MYRYQSPHFTRHTYDNLIGNIAGVPHPPHPFTSHLPFLIIFVDTHVASRLLICSSKHNCKAEEKK